jgi:lipopolysaccharide export system protein LptA
VREQENISIYVGNVKLVQGSLHVNSDRLVIHFNDAKELTLIEMTGKPATLRQLDNLQQQIFGEAEQIDHSEAESTIIMRRSACLDQDGDIIRSDLIRLNTATNAIEAGGSESKERVTMVINPQQNTATTNEQFPSNPKTDTSPDSND